jgi:hypothetical protein
MQIFDSQWVTGKYLHSGELAPPLVRRARNFVGPLFKDSRLGGRFDPA